MVREHYLNVLEHRIKWVYTRGYYSEYQFAYARGLYDFPTKGNYLHDSILGWADGQGDREYIYPNPAWKPGDLLQDIYPNSREFRIELNGDTHLTFLGDYEVTNQQHWLIDPLVLYPPINIEMPVFYVNRKSWDEVGHWNGDFTPNELYRNMV